MEAWKIEVENDGVGAAVIEISQSRHSVSACVDDEPSTQSRAIVFAQLLVVLDDEDERVRPTSNDTFRPSFRDECPCLALGQVDDVANIPPG